MNSDVSSSDVGSQPDFRIAVRNVRITSRRVSVTTSLVTVGATPYCSGTRINERVLLTIPSGAGELRHLRTVSDFL